MKRFEEEWVQFYSAQISCALLFLHEKKYSNNSEIILRDKTDQNLGKIRYCSLFWEIHTKTLTKQKFDHTIKKLKINFFQQI